MSQVRKELGIDATPESVFALLTDLSRLPDWSTVTLETHDPTPGPMRKGDTFKQTLRILGRKLETEWLVTELDAPHQVAYQATGPAGAQLEMRQTVKDAGGGSTVAFDVEYQLPGGFIGDLAEFIAGRRNEREVEHSMQNLKDLAEHHNG